MKNFLECVADFLKVRAFMKPLSNAFFNLGVKFHFNKEIT